MAPVIVPGRSEIWVNGRCVARHCGDFLNFSPEYMDALYAVEWWTEFDAKGEPQPEPRVA